MDKLVRDLSKEERLEKIVKNKNAAFYEGQIRSAEYFIENILPITLGSINSIRSNSKAVVDIPEASFGS